jgi:cell division protein FtsW
LGLVTLYSASYLFAVNQPGRFRDGFAPLSSNVYAIFIMIFLFPIIVLINIEWFKKGWVVVLLVIVTFIINILPFFPAFQIGSHRPGVDAMRWIYFNIGGTSLSFQPSEIIKLTLPLYLAYILDKNKDRLNTFLYGPLPPALVTGVFCALAFFQSNFSEVVVIGLISVMVCFASGLRVRWVFLALVVVVPVIALIVYLNPDGRWYQRFYSFLNSTESVYGERYQIEMSLQAIREGGFLGRGIGQGVLKTRLPEVHGDFVFASFAEETGFAGVTLFFAVIGAFAFAGYKVAWQSGNRFDQLLAFALVSSVVVQTLLNVAVTVNAVPTTGMPLPFVSAGGSSLLLNLTGAALLVNIARRFSKSAKEIY